jgi:hypothetical protein
MTPLDVYGRVTPTKDKQKFTIRWDFSLPRSSHRYFHHGYYDPCDILHTPFQEEGTMDANAVSVLLWETCL